MATNDFVRELLSFPECKEMMGLGSSGSALHGVFGSAVASFPSSSCLVVVVRFCIHGFCFCAGHTSGVVCIQALFHRTAAVWRRSASACVVLWQAVYCVRAPLAGVSHQAMMLVVLKSQGFSCVGLCYPPG